MSSSRWPSLFAAQAGWMLDAADFLLFTYALRTIQKEFGFGAGTMGLLSTVALLAAAVGGVTFGRLADRIGRVRTMTFSMLLYSLATAGLATSHSIGALVFWRVLVGLGMGGEWSAGSVLVAETWPPDKRARAVGFMQSGWAIGAILAALLSAFALERFGWRVLFLCGVFPALVALVIRLRVPEPELWIQRKAINESSAPHDGMFSRRYRGRTLAASAVATSVLIAYWGLITWLPTFLAASRGQGGAGLGVTRGALWTVLIQLGAFVGYNSFGFLADRVGRRLIFTLFMAGATITVPLYAWAAGTPSLLLLIGPLLGFFAHGYFSVFGALLSELFPTAIRATAQGFCYNIGRLFSAGAPYVIGLASASMGLGAALSLNAIFFLVAGALIWLLPETRGVELSEIAA